jgi:hypothetical protein
MPSTPTNLLRPVNQLAYPTQEWRGAHHVATPFADVIPSLPLVENLPSADPFRLANDVGESDVFYPGDW